MYLAILLAGLAMVIHFVMAVLVLVRSPRNQAHRTFSGMLFLFFVWSAAELLLLHYPERRWFLSLLFTPIVILPYLFARFTALFPHRVSEALILIPGGRGLAVLSPVILLLVLVWSDHLFSTIDAFPLGLRLQFGSWEYLAKLILAGYLLLSLRSLQQARANASGLVPEKRTQYTFAGLVLPAAGGAIFLLASRWYFQQPGYTMYLFGLFPALGVFMAALLGYAMLRYRLLEIDLIFSIGLVYTLMTGLIAGVLELLENVLQNLFEMTGVWATVFSTLVIAAAFNPLKNLICMLIDYLFGRQNFDSAAVLRHLLREMRRADSTSDVLNNLLRECAPVLGFNRALIVLEDDTRVAWPADSAVSAHFAKLPADLLEKTEEIDTLLEICLEEFPDYLVPLHKWQNEGFSIVYPIMRDHTCIGILLLSPKTSRIPYSEQERTLILSISHEISPVVENLHLVASLLARDRAAREVDQALRMCRQIQTTPGRRDIGRWEAYLFSSLAESIKGDLIDIDAARPEPFLCLCDAFHQGIPAALTLYIVRTTLRSAPLSERLSILQTLLLQSSDPPLRTALTLIDFRGTSLHVTCAGNPPPLLLEPGKPPRDLCTSGSPVGIGETVKTGSATLVRDTPGVICLATNGLWKALGDETGTGLRAFLAERSALPAHQLYACLTEYLTTSTSSATIQDDISFVLLQEKSAP